MADKPEEIPTLNYAEQIRSAGLERVDWPTTASRSVWGKEAGPSLIRTQNSETVSLPTLHVNDERRNIYDVYSVNSDVAKIYEKNRPAIVRINTVDPKIDATFSTSAGSGSIVDGTGIIATGYHVIKNATALRVKTADGKVYEASIIDADAGKDQALIKIKTNNPFSVFPTVKLAADSNSAKQAQRSLLALGFPKNEEAMHVSMLNSDKPVRLGDLPIKGGFLPGEDTNRTLIRSLGPAQNGNSGGPVFDLSSGEQIGMVNMSDRADTYITPVEDLYAFMARTKMKLGINTLPQSSAQDLNTAFMSSYAKPYANGARSLGLQSLDSMLK